MSERHSDVDTHRSYSNELKIIGFVIDELVRKIFCGCLAYTLAV